MFIVRWELILANMSQEFAPTRGQDKKRLPFSGGFGIIMSFEMGAKFAPQFIVGKSPTPNPVGAIRRRGGGVVQKPCVPTP